MASSPDVPLIDPALLTGRNRATPNQRLAEVDRLLAEANGLALDAPEVAALLVAAAQVHATAAQAQILINNGGR